MAPIADGTEASRPDFATLYERYYPLVFAFALRRTRDRAQAEDIAAQTFAQALQAFGRYEDRGAPPTAWLCRIAYNNVIAEQRRWQHRATLRYDPELHDEHEDRSAEGAPHEWLEWQERKAWVRAHLALLTAEQHDALYLRYWEERSMQEVAVRMGRSENAAKQLLHRARIALRAGLRKDLVPS